MTHDHVLKAQGYIYISLCHGCSSRIYYFTSTKFFKVIDKLETLNVNIYILISSLIYLLDIFTNIL